MRWTLALVPITVVVAAVALASEQAPPAAAPSYARDVEPIFVKACSDCHGGDNPKKGLDLSRGRGYAQLVGVASQEEPGLARVKAGDPANSYLWMKLVHTTKEGRGMPRTLFSSKKLPQQDLDVVERWIKAGAQP